MSHEHLTSQCRHARRGAARSIYCATQAPSARYSASASGLTNSAVLALQASKHPSAFEIAKVVSIAESTVQIAYANLKTEARTLVPAWFASQEDITRLPDY